MNKKIGLLLGSFDPPHLGHLWAANYALNQDLDEVWVIPAWKNPWKTGQTDFDHRFEMCKLMFNNEEETIKSCNIDKIYKSEYTYEGLERLLYSTSHFSRKYYIIGGTDITREIPLWRKGDWILENFGIIEVPRLLNYLESDLGIKCSSTIIRNMIKDGKNPTPFINKEIYNYITKNNLYEKSN